jgi:hypothetical protein
MKRPKLKDAGHQLPWWVAQASFHPGPRAPGLEMAAKGNQWFRTRKICFQGPPASDLRDSECLLHGVHFNWKGLEKPAERWFDALNLSLG